MHKIQRQIFAKVTSGKSFRFTDLKPEGLENDQYNYHLKSLIKKGLIEKNADRYKITFEGKQFQEEELSINRNSQIIDKFNVASLVIVVSSENQVLYQKRAR